MPNKTSEQFAKENQIIHIFNVLIKMTKEDRTLHIFNLVYSRDIKYKTYKKVLTLLKLITKEEDNAPYGRKIDTELGEQLKKEIQEISRIVDLYDPKFPDIISKLRHLYALVHLSSFE